MPTALALDAQPVVCSCDNGHNGMALAAAGDPPTSLHELSALHASTDSVLTAWSLLISHFYK